MAVTGLIMIAFLLMHMYGNLKMFQGPEAFVGYADWLKGGILYPIFPEGGFIWVFRVFMLASVVLHIWSAASLTRQTFAVRGGGNQTTKRIAQTYSARTMRWGGVLIAGFIILHLLQFTVRVLETGFDSDADAYQMVVLSFQTWWVFIFYAVLMVLIVMHVRHGFWSAFVTLGANASPRTQKAFNWIAIAIAVILYVGFMIMPVGVLLGWIV